jgi:hypothetical protein
MKRWITPAFDLHDWEILLRLTLIDLLLRPIGPWGIRPFILVLAASGLIFPKILRTPITWLSLSILLAALIIADWPMPDNHIYLLAYWCLCLFLTLISPHKELTLTKGSRLLIAFAFLFAMLWKALLAPDFLDGRFFRVTLLSDERFQDSVLFLGGLNRGDLKHNRRYLEPLPPGAELLNPPKLIEPPAFRMFATVATWGTLVFEAIIAIFFLIPAEKLYWPRHVMLLLFCVVTYSFAPVAGFGWLLLVMGMALCRSEHPVLKAIYVTAFFLVLIFAEIPWAGGIAHE